MVADDSKVGMTDSRLDVEGIGNGEGAPSQPRGGYPLPANYGAISSPVGPWLKLNLYNLNAKEAIWWLIALDFQRKQRLSLISKKYF